ncbi:MAG TPA: alcohol dehydrogenase catalytic domain-containing protein [Propionibacteriaceae bacterium]|nr:alcohol dehydrogenase catalytic domain-containing protein [Propionibacteriaceae bacterium]
MSTMKAVVAHAPGDYRYEDVPVPEVGPGEALMKVAACGVCAGDIKSFHGGIRIWGTSEADRYIDAPVTGGHEMCGTIVEVGEGSDLAVGDFVVTEQILPCGECPYCRRGMHWLCTRSAVYGFKHVCQGGFAEYVLLPATAVNHRIPEGMTIEQAALVEPIACGMHAVEQAGIRHDDVVVIAGLGWIGLAMLSIAASHMPQLLIGLDVRADRLALGAEFGADVVLNPMECDLPAEIRRLTDGLGCDVYIEASGSAASVTQGLESLRQRGRYVQMGVFADLVTADWNIIGDGKELTIIGSHLSGLTYPAVIKGIAEGRIRTEGLVTHTYPLEDWREAFEAAEKAPGARKVLLVP